MNEHALHELLAVLSDAAGLTQPEQFVHNYMGCNGAVMDYGGHWQCASCGSQLTKQQRPGQPYPGMETQRQPSPQARTFIASKLGPPSMTYNMAPAYTGAASPGSYGGGAGSTFPVQSYPPITQEQIQKAFPPLAPLGSPATTEPEHFMDDINQDLEKYTKAL